MMEHRFRGKRIDNGEWVYGYYVHQATTTIYGEIKWLHTIYVPNEAGFTDHFIVDPETVGQYICQKDCHGKDIYEGDVVPQGDNYPSVIEWQCNREQDEFIGFHLHEIYPKGEPDRWHSMFAYTSELEVIGNRYENPELLKP